MADKQIVAPGAAMPVEALLTIHRVALIKGPPFALGTLWPHPTPGFLTMDMSLGLDFVHEGSLLPLAGSLSGQ